MEAFFNHSACTTHHSVKSLVSNDVLLLYRKVIFTFVWPTILLFGVTSNVINVIIFCGMKPRHSVTLSFLALSLTDLLYLFLSSVAMVCSVMDVYFASYEWVLDPMSLYVVIYWYAYVFYDASTLLTVFIAIVRCCCVAIPLRFKGVFTKSRTTTILVILVIVPALLRLPMMVTFGLTWVDNPLTNSSRILLEVQGDLELARAINDIVNRSILPWLAFTIILVCLILLTLGLHRASEFRQISQRTSEIPQTDKSNVSQRTFKKIAHLTSNTSSVNRSRTIPAISSTDQSQLSEHTLNTMGSLTSDTLPIAQPQNISENSPPDRSHLSNSPLKKSLPLSTASSVIVPSQSTSENSPSDQSHLSRSTLKQTINLSSAASSDETSRNISEISPTDQNYTKNTSVPSEHHSSVITQSKSKNTRLKQQPVMSSRDIQMIKSVALVSAMFVVLASPFMAYSLARRLIPAFNQFGLYNNLFSVISSFSQTCGYLNSSLNALIYYFCNTKYRAELLALIGWKDKNGL